MKREFDCPVDADTKESVVSQLKNMTNDVENNIVEITGGYTEIDYDRDNLETGMPFTGAICVEVKGTLSEDIILLLKRLELLNDLIKAL